MCVLTICPDLTKPLHEKDGLRGKRQERSGLVLWRLCHLYLLTDVQRKIEKNENTRDVNKFSGFVVVIHLQLP